MFLNKFGVLPKHGTHLNTYFEDIPTSNTHNGNMIVTIFTHPKYNFTHPGGPDEWLGGTLKLL